MKVSTKFNVDTTISVAL